MSTTSTTYQLTSEMGQFIQLSDWTQDFLSGENGLRIGKKLDKEVCEHPNQLFHISLKGVDAVSPSFINGAFVYLLELYGEEYFKKYIKLENANQRTAKSISESLKGFIAHRNEFYKNFSINKIYLIGDDSFQANQAIRELHTANFQNVDFFYKNPNQIPFSSCAIGILTEISRQKEFFEQINQVLSMGKPVLVLYNKRIGINTPSSIQNKFQKIAFDHDSLSLTIRNINEYVKQNTVRKKTGSATGSKDIVELAAWTVLGLAAVFLANRLAEE